MSLISIAIVAFMVLVTSFISGVFGMAGGMILMGGLLFLMPVASAMVLHGFTQMASNGWRAILWHRHIVWSIVLRYVLGMVAAAGLFSLLRFAPAQAMVFLFLGLIPFIALAIPTRIVPQADKRGGAELTGLLCTSLQLMAGVSGPALDIFFVRSHMDRRAVVATKAASQSLSHLTKLLYFGYVVHSTDAAQVPGWVILGCIALAMAGTTSSRLVLEKLTDHSFRRYSRWIVSLIGVVYIFKALTTLH
ncbi:sulfite exporter TauE/SafE family protein [Allopusillimonas soli]|nr:sulfite exporter TauE/SafE family protein [Allopusillimonas soli]